MVEKSIIINVFLVKVPFYCNQQNSQTVEILNKYRYTNGILEIRN